MRQPLRPPLTALEGGEKQLLDLHFARSLRKTKIRPKSRDIYYFGPYSVTLVEGTNDQACVSKAVRTS
jgi:hypothetical protein